MEESSVWIVTHSIMRDDAAVKSGVLSSNDAEGAWVLFGARVIVVLFMVPLEERVLAEFLVFAALRELEVLQVQEVVRVARLAGLDRSVAKLPLSVCNLDYLRGRRESHVMALDVLDIVVSPDFLLLSSWRRMFLTSTSRPSMAPAVGSVEFATASEPSTGSAAGCSMGVANAAPIRERVRIVLKDTILTRGGLWKMFRIMD